MHCCLKLLFPRFIQLFFFWCCCCTMHNFLLFVAMRRGSTCLPQLGLWFTSPSIYKCFDLLSGNHMPYIGKWLGTGTLASVTFVTCAAWRSPCSFCLFCGCCGCAAAVIVLCRDQVPSETKTKTTTTGPTKTGTTGTVGTVGHGTAGTAGTTRTTGTAGTTTASTRTRRREPERWDRGHTVLCAVAHSWTLLCRRRCRSLRTICAIDLYQSPGKHCQSMWKKKPSHA